MAEGQSLRVEYERLLEEGSRCTASQLDHNLARLRELVLLKGFPPETPEERDRSDHAISLRGRVWKILLRVRKTSPTNYEKLVNQGPSPSDVIIQLDASRTLPNDEQFRDRVTNDMLVRILNAWQHHLIENGEVLMYSQGVNCYVAPFLYVMPELDAFHCLCKLTKSHCPLYLKGPNQNLPGAYKAVELFGKILDEIDPELATFLKEKNMAPPTYAFSAVHGMNITLNPLREWLQLWDVAICLGVHLHLIFAVARVVLIREQLMKSEQPNNLLNPKRWPPLKAKTIVNVGMQIVKCLNEELYASVLLHPFNSETSDDKISLFTS